MARRGSLMKDVLAVCVAALVASGVAAGGAVLTLGAPKAVAKATPAPPMSGEPVYVF